MVGGDRDNGNDGRCGCLCLFLDWLEGEQDRERGIKATQPPCGAFSRPGVLGCRAGMG